MRPRLLPTWCRQRRSRETRYRVTIALTGPAHWVYSGNPTAVFRGVSAVTYSIMVLTLCVAMAIAGVCIVFWPPRY
jgi:hypothetical protein